MMIVPTHDTQKNYKTLKNKTFRVNYKTGVANPRLASRIRFFAWLYAAFTERYCYGKNSCSNGIKDFEDLLQNVLTSL